jgi:hypothetical protein
MRLLVAATDLSTARPHILATRCTAGARNRLGPVPNQIKQQHTKNHTIDLSMSHELKKNSTTKRAAHIHSRAFAIIQQSKEPLLHLHAAIQHSLDQQLNKPARTNAPSQQNSHKNSSKPNPAERKHNGHPKKQQAWCQQRIETKNSQRQFGKSTRHLGRPHIESGLSHLLRLLAKRTRLQTVNKYHARNSTHQILYQFLNFKLFFFLKHIFIYMYKQNNRDQIKSNFEICMFKQSRLQRTVFFFFFNCRYRIIQINKIFKKK